ncbi:MAG: LptA/OstA family protein [Nitrospinales bacterium]
MNVKIAVIIWLLVITMSQAGHAQDLLRKESGSHGGEPIEISSERMRSENSGQKIVFSGNVVGQWGDLEIVSDILEIHNTQDNKKTNEIVAIGNVIITRGIKKARGDKAIYFDEAQKIILTGTPKAIAWEGKNTIEGAEMIFLLDVDRFIVNDKVRMKIYPKGRETPGTKSKKEKRK